MLSRAEFPDSNDILLIEKGISLTFQEKYAQARELFAGMEKKYPDHPAAPFFLAVILQTEMMDLEWFGAEDSFYTYLRIAIDRADRMRDINPHASWAYYFMGMANSYWTLHDGRKGSKWSALRKSIRGKNLLSRCLKIDSSLYDALVGLGLYKYWGSVKTQGFEWLPFFSDKREEGIEDLLLALDSSLFSKELAKHALVWVYIQEERFDQADSIVDELIEKYPNGKALLWAKAYGYVQAEEYTKALEILSRLYDRIKPENQPGNYNLYALGYYRTVCYFHLQQYDKALLEIDFCENLNLDRQVRERLEDKHEEIEHYRSKIRRMLKNK